MTTAETFGAAAGERLADDVAIRNLIARLAHLADASGPDDLDEYVGLFTADAVWALPGGEQSGHDDIRAAARQRRLGGQQGPGTNSRHVITTQAVRFEGPDTAVSEAVFLFVADTTTTPTIRVMGQYRDLLRREAGTWKVARREITPG